MSARPSTDCVQCKAAPAVAFGFFADLGPAAHGLPWCENCMGQLVPVLLHQGFPINLVSADPPPSLQLCEYGEDCPRLCKPGWRVCENHREELREVYAGKSSGASVDQGPGFGLFNLATGRLITNDGDYVRDGDKWRKVRDWPPAEAKAGDR